MSSIPEMVTEPVLRELVLNELRQSPEPVPTNALKKRLKIKADGEHLLLDAEIDTLLATGEVHEWTKSAKDRSIWLQAPGVYFHDKLIELLSERPLSESDALKTLAAVVPNPTVPKDKVKEYLAELVNKGQLYLVGKKFFARDPSQIVRAEILSLLRENPAVPQSANAIASLITERTKLPVNAKSIAEDLALLVDEKKIYKLKSLYLAQDPAELAAGLLTNILQNEPERIFSKNELAKQIKEQLPLALSGSDLEGLLEHLVATGKGYRHPKNGYGARPAPVPLDQKLLDALRAEWQTGGSAYPTTLGHLAERCGLPVDDPAFQSIVAKGTNAFRKGIILGSAAITPETPVALKADIAILADSIVLLERVLAVALPVGTTTTVDKLVKQVPASLQKAFRAGVERRLSEQSMPSDIAWIQTGDAACLFRVENLYPSSLRQGKHPPSAAVPAVTVPSQPRRQSGRPFEPAFTAVFNRIDREHGSNNFVSLVHLRRALPDFTHEEFDLGIWSLRQAGKYSLRPADGRNDITQEERDAGFSEYGALLLNVSRKSE